MTDDEEIRRQNTKTETTRRKTRNPRNPIPYHLTKELRLATSVNSGDHRITTLKKKNNKNKH